ncbi:MAG: T9SS type A sorting domain-containing protein [Ignavibacteria bacterium]
MKKSTFYSSLLTAALLLTILTNNSYSRIIQISAANFVFTPATVNNAVVGDTVRWTRISGSHTTTCDGQQFTSRPSGAAPWNAPLTSGNTTFSYVIQVAGTYDYICEPHSPDMHGTIIATTSAIVKLTEFVNSYELLQNYPNPFNPSTKIKFSIPASSQVTLKVYNNIGQEVATLVNERLNAASYEVDWNAFDLNSGIYYYKLNTSDFVQVKKMILIK